MRGPCLSRHQRFGRAFSGNPQAIALFKLCQLGGKRGSLEKNTGTGLISAHSERKSEGTAGFWETAPNGLRSVPFLPDDGICVITIPKAPEGGERELLGIKKRAQEFS